MKPAVAYIRCSTDQQIDSPVQQRTEIDSFGEKNDFEIKEYFEDKGISGTAFDNRPGFVRLRDRVLSGNLHGYSIIVWDESRWGRNLHDNYGWKWLFARHGVNVVAVKATPATGDEVADGVIDLVERSQVARYSKNLSVATLRGAKANAREGFSSGGSPPYGYARIAVDRVSGEKLRVLPPGVHINPQTEKAKWDIGDPDEVAIVRWMFNEKIKGMGDVAIADALNRRRVPPPKRGRWRNKDQKWSGGTVRTILENPTYCGMRAYGRHPQSHLSGPTKQAWQSPKSEWIIVEDAHPAIVTKETFELANQFRQEYHRRNRHYYESGYLLSGLIRCSNCGFNFQGTIYGAKKIRYYIDGGYANKGKSVCAHLKINQQKLEAFVIDAIRKRVLKSDLTEVLEEELRKRLKSTSLERLDSVEAYETKLSDVRKRIERIMTLVENGIRLEEQIEKLHALEREKRQVERQLEQLELMKMTPRDLVDCRAQVQYLLDNFETILKTASLANQKELLRRFIEKIVVDRTVDTVVVYLRKIPTLRNGATVTRDTVTVTRTVVPKRKPETARTGEVESELRESESNEKPNEGEIVLAKNS